MVTNNPINEKPTPQIPAFAEKMSVARCLELFMKAAQANVSTFTGEYKSGSTKLLSKSDLKSTFLLCITGCCTGSFNKYRPREPGTTTSRGHSG